MGTAGTREQRRAVNRTQRKIAMPRLGALDLEGADARRLDLWGKSLIRSVEAWEHRKMRRAEGAGGAA